MKFYDREREIEFLRQTLEKSKTGARFTVITGRRRIGKTLLVAKAYENTTMLYFFVARKSESELCDSFIEEIKEKLDIPLPESNVISFASVFEYLMQLSVEKNFTLFIDEFQEFLKVNKSVFSDMQRIWDKYEKRSKINLIVCGSIFSMMHKIFKDRKEPLYGRCTDELRVKPFTPTVLKMILSDVNPNYCNEDLLALFSITGGVAKYVQLLIDDKAFTKKKILANVISENSVFISEGKNSLVEEFGKDYGIYFSILSCIARGKNTRNEIETAIGREIGGYLTNLETEYGIISKKQPLFEKTTTKAVRYEIDDVFYTFWFRYIFRFNYIIEIGNYQKLLEIIETDYETYTGRTLEKYFARKAVESGKYTRIGRWWNRKGANEIDLIAEDEISQKVVFYEIKRKAEKVSLNLLENKANVFLSSTHEFKDYEIKCTGLSIEDM